MFSAAYCRLLQLRGNFGFNELRVPPRPAAAAAMHCCEVFLKEAVLLA